MNSGITDTLFLLGLISLVFSIVYYFRKRKSGLSKKLFYSTLIAGLVLVSVGVGFTEIDDDTQKRLDEALEQNERLEQQIEDLESDYEARIAELELQLETE